MSAFTKMVSGHKTWGGGKDKSRESLNSIILEHFSSLPAVKEQLQQPTVPVTQTHYQGHNIHFPVGISWEYDKRYHVCLAVTIAWLNAGRPASLASSPTLSKLNSKLSDHDRDFLVNWLQKTSREFTNLVQLVACDRQPLTPASPAREKKCMSKGSVTNFPESGPQSPVPCDSTCSLELSPGIRKRTSSFSSRSRLGTMSSAVRASRDKLASSCSLNVSDQPASTESSSMPVSRRRANTLTSVRITRNTADKGKKQMKLPLAPSKQLAKSTEDLSNMRLPRVPRRMTATTNMLMRTKRIKSTGSAPASTASPPEQRGALGVLDYCMSTTGAPFRSLPVSNKSKNHATTRDCEKAGGAWSINVRDRQLPQAPVLNLKMSTAPLWDTSEESSSIAKANRSSSVPLVLGNVETNNENKYLRKVQSYGGNTCISSSMPARYQFPPPKQSSLLSGCASPNMEEEDDRVEMEDIESLIISPGAIRQPRTQKAIRQRRSSSSDDSVARVEDTVSFSGSVATASADSLCNVADSVKSRSKRTMPEEEFDRLQSLFLSKSDCKLNKIAIGPSPSKIRVLAGLGKSKHRPKSAAQHNDHDGKRGDAPGYPDTGSSSRLSSLSHFKMSLANFGSRQRPASGST